MYINGVNLGNWLVLEKWMSPVLFEGTSAEDEYHLPLQLSAEVYQSRMKIHRSEFISERDFAQIRGMGLNCVRIPVPYFIFGDRPPFIGCIEELDQAFAWAEKYDLKILVDLHSVPMSQNGFDNGGICGVCRWSQMPDEVAFVLQVLEKLAKRYGGRKGLLGIEPLNEPVTETMWEVMDIPSRYPAAEKDLAEGSRPNSMDFLIKFYKEAYGRIHPYLDKGQKVVFHDAFQLKNWYHFFEENQFDDVMLDTHQYLMFAEKNGLEKRPEAYLKHIRTVFAGDIAQVQEYVDVVVGEWCIYNYYLKTEKPAEETQKIYMELSKAHLEAWKNGAGHFWWNYKLLPQTQAAGWECWDLGKAVAMDWFPGSYNKK